VTNRDPYRDERATLAAENDRLRAENAALRTHRLQRWARVALALCLFALHVAAITYVPNLINARDDGRVYLGALASVALLVVDAWAAVRLFSQKVNDQP
jgi:hypothetical protein